MFYSLSLKSSKLVINKDLKEVVFPQKDNPNMSYSRYVTRFGVLILLLLVTFVNKFRIYISLCTFHVAIRQPSAFYYFRKIEVDHVKHVLFRLSILTGIYHLIYYNLIYSMIRLSMALLSRLNLEAFLLILFMFMFIYK